MQGNLSQTIKLTGVLTPSATLSGVLTAGATLSGSLSITRGVNPDVYDGAYEIIPSPYEVTLPTEGLMMSHDVVIQPIPSYYGLISWNGSVLTVS